MRLPLGALLGGGRPANPATMKFPRAALAMLLTALLAAPAVAQGPLPPNINANTVLGRLGVGPGPVQAIPMSSLPANPTPLAPGYVLGNFGTVTATAGAVLGTEVLTAARFYYFRVDGNDTICNGKSNAAAASAPNCAFRQPQKAVDVTSRLNTNGKPVTILYGTPGVFGFFSGISVTAPWIGGGIVQISGDTTTPSNCLVQAVGNAISVSGPGSQVIVQGMKLSATFGAGSSGGNDVAVSDGATVGVGIMEFGQADLSWLNATSRGRITLVGTAYTMSATAPFPLYVFDGGWIDTDATQNRTFTLTANITVTTFASALLQSGISFHHTADVFSLGAFTVTGQRFQTFLKGSINTAGGGINYFPGTVAGVNSSGGSFDSLAYINIADIAGLSANCGTWLATASSANLRSCLTDETGTGLAYFQGGDLGTPSAGVLTNATGTASGLTAGHVTTNAASTGDATSDGTTNALTLATVNVNPGVSGNATTALQITTDAKGRMLAIAGVAMTPSLLNILGTGTGFITAGAINVGTAGSFVVNGGAGGTPSSITLTNAGGTAASLTAGTATNAVNSGITNDTTTNATMFPVWVTANTGNLPLKVSSTKVSFNPSTGVLTSTVFSGTSTGPVSGIIDASNAAAGNVGEVLTCTTPGTSATVTISNATPGIITDSAHGISIGGAVNFTTTGGLPTGLTVGTTYYVSSQSYAVGSYAVSTTVANAIAGTSINTSSAGSGVHTRVATAILATGTAKDFCGISATAGDWYVQTSMISIPANTTNVVTVQASSSTTSNTRDTSPGRLTSVFYGPSGFAFTGGVSVTSDTTDSRFNANSTQTFFAVGLETFTVAGSSAYGTIRARRASR